MIRICSCCGEPVKNCDECGCELHKGDGVYCDTNDFDKHKCTDCYTEIELGEIELE